MADAPSSLGSNKIIKVGEGKDLRKVEEDVLIPRIMKKHAMERCSEHVKGWRMPQLNNNYLANFLFSI